MEVRDAFEVLGEAVDADDGYQAAEIVAAALRVLVSSREEKIARLAGEAADYREQLSELEEYLAGGRRADSLASVAARFEQVAELTPVSYTHLTLPTICSV